MFYFSLLKQAMSHIHICICILTQTISNIHSRLIPRSCDKNKIDNEKQRHSWPKVNDGIKLSTQLANIPNSNTMRKMGLKVNDSHPKFSDHTNLFGDSAYLQIIISFEF